MYDSALLKSAGNISSVTFQPKTTRYDCSPVNIQHAVAEAFWVVRHEGVSTHPRTRRAGLTVDKRATWPKPKQKKKAKKKIQAGRHRHRTTDGGEPLPLMRAPGPRAARGVAWLPAVSRLACGPPRRETCAPVCCAVLRQHAAARRPFFCVWLVGGSGGIKY